MLSRGVRLGVVLGGVLAALLLAWVLIGDDEGGGDSCGSLPFTGLTPSGGGTAAYTMGVRVNQHSDVAAIESAIGSRILPRDVFVVNTEFAGSDTASWERTVSELKDRFSCNRVATLNGLGTRPGRAGDMLALAGHPDVDAVLLDWEPDTWAGSGQGAWSAELEANLGRISERLRSLSQRLRAGETRMGLVPDYLPAWDYGRTARVVAELNRELDPEHRGYQVVQTQPNCGSPSAPGPLIGPLAAELRRQYRPLAELVSTDHLGFEIAFDTDPNPNASETVERVGPEQAARCTDEILSAGGGAVLYWAAPDALRAMLETPVGRSLRPVGRD